MTLVITNFENELIWHSAGVTYQALGQMHGDFKTFETVSTHNQHRIWPRKQKVRGLCQRKCSSCSRERKTEEARGKVSGC